MLPAVDRERVNTQPLERWNGSYALDGEAFLGSRSGQATAEAKQGIRLALPYVQGVGLTNKLTMLYPFPPHKL